MLFQNIPMSHEKTKHSNTFHRIAPKSPKTANPSAFSPKTYFLQEKKVAESDNWSNPRVVEGEISLPVLFAGCLKRDVNAIRQLSTRADAASIVKQFL